MAGDSDADLRGEEVESFSILLFLEQLIKKQIFLTVSINLETSLTYATPLVLISIYTPTSLLLLNLTTALYFNFNGFSVTAFSYFKCISNIRLHEIFWKVRSSNFSISFDGYSASSVSDVNILDLQIKGFGNYLISQHC